MTKEEMVNSLNAIIEKFLARYGGETIIKIPISGDDIQALDMAVKLLTEQEPKTRSVNPQESSLKMRHPTEQERESVNAYIDSISTPIEPKTDILDKIRAEIQDSIRSCVMMGGSERAYGLREASDIIDKYRQEG